jgi:hypothetical protein
MLTRLTKSNPVTLMQQLRQNPILPDLIKLEILEQPGQYLIPGALSRQIYKQTDLSLSDILNQLIGSFERFQQGDLTRQDLLLLFQKYPSNPGQSAVACLRTSSGSGKKIPSASQRILLG